MPIIVKTHVIGSWWVRDALRAGAEPLALERPDDVDPRFAGAGRGLVDRFAGPFDALFGVRVAMMPKVRRRHRRTHSGSPMTAAIRYQPDTSDRSRQAGKR
ncbi:hypothetical protein [Nonomuraea rhodomycinica]|uniref:hypothetical protein n=1 Tax=Nonomuraea rhodomycinica TaxID=1712872 RepID=UPI001FE65099|nr:hypothetical protein [Nonomuraea rhodomycinica]